MSTLITRPRYDSPTHYLYHWSQSLADIASFDLKNERASRREVESFLKKKEPDVVIFNGHGDDVSIRGQDGEPLIVANENAGLLQNKNVYFRACDAGRVLGPTIIKYGARGFVGYVQPFIFPYDEFSVSRPLEDEVARPCLESSNEVAMHLATGSSAREAHEAGLKMFRANIVKMLTTKAPNSYIIGFLHWNMVSQVCDGDV